MSIHVFCFHVPGYLNHTSDNKIICESCSGTSTTAGTKCNSFKKKKVDIFISVFKYDDEEDADWYLIGKIMFVTYF